MTSYPMQPKSKQSEIGDPFRAPPSGQRLYYTLAAKNRRWPIRKWENIML